MNELSPLSYCPLKLSPPLGAAMAFLGMEGSLPLFHGSQGCTAFALVLLVRHFREPIPLQTTAMNEISAILGGMDQVEEGLKNIVKRAKPQIIGVISTALSETRGEDLAGDLKVILKRNPELKDTTIIPVSAPDFVGSLQEGWAKAVSAIIKAKIKPGKINPRQVNLLPGVHLTPGEVEAVKDIITSLGLKVVVAPDLSRSLDGYVPERYIPTSLGGASLTEIQAMGEAALTLALGEHMQSSAQLIEEICQTPYRVIPSLSGLRGSDKLIAVLREHFSLEIPERLKKERARLEDAMLDGHFFFAGRKFALAGEADMVANLQGLIEELGGETLTVTSLEGDFGLLEEKIKQKNGVDLVLANTNARLLCSRLNLPHFRVGIPIYDRLGAGWLNHVGYKGSRELIFKLANILQEKGEGHGS